MDPDAFLSAKHPANPVHPVCKGLAVCRRVLPVPWVQTESPPGSCAPPGLYLPNARSSGLTPWAIICRCSAPRARPLQARRAERQ
jgi:hypothetical protein